MYALPHHIRVWYSCIEKQWKERKWNWNNNNDKYQICLLLRSKLPILLLILQMIVYILPNPVIWYSNGIAFFVEILNIGTLLPCIAQRNQNMFHPNKCTMYDHRNWLSNIRFASNFIQFTLNKRPVWHMKCAIPLSQYFILLNSTTQSMKFNVIFRK